MSSKGEYTMFYILCPDGRGKQGRATSELFNGPHQLIGGVTASAWIIRPLLAISRSDASTVNLTLDLCQIRGVISSGDWKEI